MKGMNTNLIRGPLHYHMTTPPPPSRDRHVLLTGTPGTLEDLCSRSVLTLPITVASLHSPGVTPDSKVPMGRMNATPFVVSPSCSPEGTRCHVGAIACVFVCVCVCVCVCVHTTYDSCVALMIVDYSIFTIIRCSRLIGSWHLMRQLQLIVDSLRAVSFPLCQMQLHTAGQYRVGVGHTVSYRHSETLYCFPCRPSFHLHQPLFPQRQSLLLSQQICQSGRGQLRELEPQV